MKEKSDFITILENIISNFPAHGRIFAGDNSCGPSDNKDIEIYQWPMFDIPVSGEKRIRFPSNGKIREEIIRPGDILFTPARCWKCTKWDLPHELFCFIMQEKYLRYTYVDYRKVDPDFRRPVCNDFFHTNQAPPQLIHEQTRLLMECCTHLQLNSAAILMVQTLLHFGLELLRKDSALTASGKAQQTFMQLMQYLRENYRTHITRRDAAVQFDLNECYISRLFRDQCGKSFSAKLRDMRMHHAAFLLTNTDLTISEVAEQCGYESLQSFTTIFRQHNGMPPAKYRLAKTAFGTAVQPADLHNDPGK